MNWYNKKFANSRSRKLETISKSLTTYTLNNLKNKKLQNNFDIDSIGVSFSYTCYVRKDKIREFECGGGYSPSRKILEIEIHIPREYLIVNTSEIYINPIYLSQLYSSLLDAIRHEIQHAWQDRNGELANIVSPDPFSFANTRTRKNLFIKIKNYILNQFETEAFVSSIILKAKREKKNIKEEINIYMKDYIRAAIENNKNDYTEYLKEHGDLKYLIREISDALYAFAKRKYHIKDNPIQL